MILDFDHSILPGQNVAIATKKSEQHSTSCFQLLFSTSQQAVGVCGLLTKRNGTGALLQLRPKSVQARCGRHLIDRNLQSRHRCRMQCGHLVDWGIVKILFHPSVNCGFGWLGKVHIGSNCPASKSGVGGAVVLHLIVRDVQPDELDHETGEGAACLFCSIFSHLIV